MYNCRAIKVTVTAFFGTFLAASGASIQEGWIPRLDEGVRSAMDRIKPASLKGHVAFLSSDLLEGRGTPSKGLDIAAEYAAAQLRRAGLQPAVKGSYFQEIPWPPGEERKETVRNVVAVLPGSDPFLKDTYVIVSAHYDHLGVSSRDVKDKIYNGANDNGSGTAGVLELATAMAEMTPRPKRSIVFVLWAGEEKGLVGSRFYGENPIFPIGKTVALVNLEQIGRTDDDEKKRERAFAVTGYDYSDLGPILRESARRVGVDVERHPRFSDSYFGRSDNQALADLGVPAHTVCTAFSYPDYHKASDEWEKLDYDNMASVLRGVLVGVATIAESPKQPQWNRDNPKADRYRQARERR